MLEGFFGAETFVRVVDEDFAEEVEELSIEGGSGRNDVLRDVSSCSVIGRRKTGGEGKKDDR